MQFSSTEFFKKKVKSSKNVTKMVLPNYYFASLLRREKQETRENTEEHSSLLEGPTNKEQSLRSKKTVTKGNILKKKNIAFLWRRESTKKEKNTEFIVEKGKKIRKKGWEFSKRGFSFLLKKVEKTKKNRRCKSCQKKKSENHRNQKEGQGTRKMCTKKKKKNKTKRTKWKMVKKEMKKRREKNPRGRREQERESRRERKENGWKKGYTKEVLRKEAREIF